MIEPYRSGLVPGFATVQSAAMEAGALGCTLAGAGPSLFAWCHNDRAEDVRAAMRAAFEDHSVTADAWVSPLDAPGARLVDRHVDPEHPAPDVATS
jgi:homoserine kinase